MTFLENYKKTYSKLNFQTSIMGIKVVRKMSSVCAPVAQLVVARDL